MRVIGQTIDWIEVIENVRKPQITEIFNRDFLNDEDSAWDFIINFFDEDEEGTLFYEETADIFALSRYSDNIEFKLQLIK